MAVHFFDHYCTEETTLKSICKIYIKTLFIYAILNSALRSGFYE